MDKWGEGGTRRVRAKRRGSTSHHDEMRLTPQGVADGISELPVVILWRLLSMNSASD
ncbi:hypothetical protein D3C79_596010 [compost metagenome]